MVLRATSEDKIRGMSLLRDRLREGKVTYEEFLRRETLIKTAKYSADVFTVVFADDKRMRVKGIREITSFRYVATVLLASLAGLLIGFGFSNEAVDSIEASILALLIGGASVRGYRNARKRSIRVDDLDTGQGLSSQRD